jgi:Thioredoxin like C-terminal domain
MAPSGAPTSIPQDEYAHDGNWAIGSESSNFGSGASIELRYQAKEVYLVLGGTGTVSVSVNGTITKSVVISGEPKLYQLTRASSSQGALLLLSVTPGVAAYDFTFG